MTMTNTPQELGRTTDPEHRCCITLGCTRCISEDLHQRDLRGQIAVLVAIDIGRLAIARAKQDESHAYLELVDVIDFKRLREDLESGCEPVPELARRLTLSYADYYDLRCAEVSRRSNVKTHLSLTKQILRGATGFRLHATPNADDILDDVINTIALEEAEHGTSSEEDKQWAARMAADMQLQIAEWRRRHLKVANPASEGGVGPDPSGVEASP